MVSVKHASACFAFSNYNQARDRDATTSLPTPISTPSRSASPTSPPYPAPDIHPEGGWALSAAYPTPSPTPSRILQRAPFVNAFHNDHSRVTPSKRTRQVAGAGGGQDPEDSGDLEDPNQDMQRRRPDDECPRNAKKPRRKRKQPAQYAISATGECVQATDPATAMVELMAHGADSVDLKNRLGGLREELSGEGVSSSTNLQHLTSQNVVGSIVNQIHDLEKKQMASQFTTFSFKVQLAFKVNR